MNLTNIINIPKYATHHNINYDFSSNKTRVLFFCKHKNDYSRVQKYANGVIFEKIGNAWTQVCFPLANLINTDDIPVPEKEFGVYPLYDATIFNVYYSLLDQQWYIGTQKKYTIEGSEFRGIKMTDLISLDKITDYFQKNNLVQDQNFTYIFAVSNPRLHVTVNSFTEEPQIRLIAKNNHVYNLYEGLDYSIDKIKFLMKETPSILGFIVRTDDYDYVIESESWKDLKNHFYTPETNNQIGFTNNNNINHVIVRCYVFCQNNILFEKIEQKWPDIINKLKQKQIESSKTTQVSILYDFLVSEFLNNKN